MGEHTDYNEGFVLPFALAQGVTATASPRDDGLLVLRSKQVPDEPATVAVDSVAPGAVTGWAAYPAGVAWALRAAGHAVRGASVDVDSDLPVGAGVSSSAAIECSVALALCSLSGVTVPRQDLAAIARRAENEFVGAPTGIIDQSATLLCREGHALLLDCGTLATTQVPFLPAAAGVAALVIDTRVTHALVSGEYAARRAECEAAARLLGVPALGAVTELRVLDRLADPLLRRRARHVITDSARARALSVITCRARRRSNGSASRSSTRSSVTAPSAGTPSSRAAASHSARRAAYSPETSACVTRVSITKAATPAAAGRNGTWVVASVPQSSSSA